MTWISVDEWASGRDHAIWEELLDGGEPETYRDTRGRQWVWQDPQREALRCLLALHAGPPPALAPGEDPLDEELEDLPLAAAEPPADDATPTEALGRPGSSAADPEARAAHLLQRVDELWSGSERELERAAGLPKAFLAKAKRGERSGPRSSPSWERLEGFLASRAA